MPFEPTPDRADSRDLVRLKVSALLRRARLTSFGRTFLRTGFYACCAAAAGAFLLRGEAIPILAAGAGGLALLVAAVTTPFRQRDPIALAKLLDEHGGLADRLSTAVDLLPRTTGVAEAVLEDAARKAEGIRPGQVIPFRSPREAYYLPLPILALVAIPLMVFPPPPGPSAEFLAAVDQRLEALEDFLETEKTGTLSPEREAALDRLRRLADELGKKPVTKRSILAAAGKVIAEMRSDKKKMIQKRAKDMTSLLERMKEVPLLKPIALEIESAHFSQATRMLERVLEKLADKRIQIDDLGDVGEEELKALLRRLRNLNKDIRFVNKVLQFLEELEGEIGELSDLMDPDDLEFWQNPNRPPRRKQREPGQQQQGNRPDDRWGRGTTESPFGDPKRDEPEETEEEGVRAKEGKGKSSSSVLKAPQESGRSALSYREKYAKYRQLAEDVLYREEIPVGYREYIKRYFDMIQPEEEE